ncbi:oxamate carbamoyltransferase subunit AllH family protein [Phycicoccus sonneratiae]|uniref:DUF2877 domain-containing protein n=1 Tax=Phycicoccus sonneratiae TaxID=2807628 RepID=A0ABS2CMM4_9MICO|nr:DUF2877 domain-containing protein [Phycicoccus sonneraticus]MBM6401127.1 DUF2877 domain-containing protein [Phycicoccus sonneraticus]
MPSPAPASPRGRVVLPGALSPLTADLVRGPRRPYTVVGVFRAGAYLATVDRVLPLLAHDAVALPGALRLAEPADRLDLGVRAGDVVVGGAGSLHLPGVTVRGVRTWRPARVRRAPAVPRLAPDERLRALLAEASSAGSRWLLPAVRAALVAPLPTEAVRHLVGRGEGLTPSGDDALAGALLARRALGLAPGATAGGRDPLALAVRDRLRATTAVSASLLAAALDGWTTPEVAALVGALARGDADATRSALPSVLAVGHTSGRDLVTGVRAVLDTVASTGRTAA